MKEWKHTHSCIVIVYSMHTFLSWHSSRKTGCHPLIFATQLLLFFAQFSLFILGFCLFGQIRWKWASAYVTFFFFWFLALHSLEQVLQHELSSLPPFVRQLYLGRQILKTYLGWSTSWWAQLTSSRLRNPNFFFHSFVEKLENKKNLVAIDRRWNVSRPQTQPVALLFVVLVMMMSKKKLARAWVWNESSWKCKEEDWRRGRRRRKTDISETLSWSPAFRQGF